MKSITQQELNEKREKQDLQLIDVRTEQEYSEGTIHNAPNIPHDQISDKVENQFPDKEQEYVLFCRTQGRSQFAAHSMENLGYKNVSFLIGGYSDWQDE